jgi:hypothetical protein
MYVLLTKQLEHGHGKQDKKEEEENKKNKRERTNKQQNRRLCSMQNASTASVSVYLASHLFSMRNILSAAVLACLPPQRIRLLEPVVF